MCYTENVIFLFNPIVDFKQARPERNFYDQRSGQGEYEVELVPDDDVWGNSTLNYMLTWYKFNSVIEQFYFEV
jgi:hypothetical protein